MTCKADDPEYLAKQRAERAKFNGSFAREINRDESDRDPDGVYAMRDGYEELDLLLGVVMDPTLDLRTRIAAADKLAPFRHSKKSEPMAVISFDMAGFLRQLHEDDRRINGAAPTDEPTSAPEDLGPRSGGCM